MRSLARSPTTRPAGRPAARRAVVQPQAVAKRDGVEETRETLNFARRPLYPLSAHRSPRPSLTAAAALTAATATLVASPAHADVDAVVDGTVQVVKVWRREERRK